MTALRLELTKLSSFSVNKLAFLRDNVEIIKEELDGKGLGR